MVGCFGCGRMNECCEVDFNRFQVKCVDVFNGNEYEVGEDEQQLLTRTPNLLSSLIFSVLNYLYFDDCDISLNLITEFVSG